MKAKAQRTIMGAFIIVGLLVMMSGFVGYNSEIGIKTVKIGTLLLIIGVGYFTIDRMLNQSSKH